MKKALVITYNPNHDFGGTELYAEKVINILKSKKWDVTEFSLNVRNETPKSKSSHKLIFPNKKVTEKIGLRNLHFLKEAKRQLDEFKKNNKFDLIINNLGDGFKWEFIPENEILIQHFSVEKYDNGTIYKSKFLNAFTRFFYRLIGFGNYLLMHNSVVFFNDENNQYANKFYNKKFNSIENIDLSVLNESQINKTKKSNNPKKIVYIGRLDNRQKNIKFLVRVAKYLHTEIDVYGNGPAKKFLKRKKNINYCGFAKKDQIFNIYSNHLASIIVSRFEGEPFAAIESLSSSTPVIIRNTFLNASVLLSNNNGLLLDKKLSAKKCAHSINSYIENANLDNHSKNAKELAIKKFADDIFEEKWKKILDRF